MKKTLIMAAALIAASASVVLAQDDGKRNREEVPGFLRRLQHAPANLVKNGREARTGIGGRRAAGAKLFSVDTAPFSNFTRIANSLSTIDAFARAG